MIQTLLQQAASLIAFFQGEFANSEGKKKRKKRHAEKRCGKAEQIKQSSDLLGFVLAKNAPCILIRSAVQLALTALLMPFRRSELSLFNTSVFLFQDFFFLCMSDCRICCRREGGSQRREDGSPDPGCSCLRFPAAGCVPNAFFRGWGVHLF